MFNIAASLLLELLTLSDIRLLVTFCKKAPPAQAQSLPDCQTDSEAIRVQEMSIFVKISVKNRTSTENISSDHLGQDFNFSVVKKFEDNSVTILDNRRLFG